MDRRYGHNSHLTSDQVKRIRRLAAAGWSRDKLARAFDTDVSNVGYILRRDTHKGV